MTSQDRGAGVVDTGELPAGTVSLLFSDVEGSTRLLSRLGGRYEDALDGHRQVLRAAWNQHGGTELGTEGDSFFVVFSTATEAVAASVDAQRQLVAHQWPENQPVRVRMGIHTGSPKVHDGSYVGMDVHRAARIAGAAHGGQVLLSRTTADLAETALPDEVWLKDLGSHMLKDLPSAERLFQVAIGGLPTDFPPPKALGTTTSLPQPRTPLVGRESDIDALCNLMSGAGVRLVTLAGPGGAGKTRLAVELAHQLVGQFADGVHFVPLEDVTTIDEVWSKMADVIGAPSRARAAGEFLEFIAHQHSFLVLDGLEAIASVDAVVSQLLTAAPGVSVAATSRRPLHVVGEHQHVVAPLELPASTDVKEARKASSVRLFELHAKAVRASFAVDATNVREVVNICERLDGLPLAIELAAARVKMLSPAALLARLDRALELEDTAVDRPARQQSLRSTIAGSYEMLGDDLKGLFSRLGVFAGGADLEAVARIAELGDERELLGFLARLVDSSLVNVRDDISGEPRITLLQTVRTYARDRLSQAGQLQATRERHARHYGSVAERLSPLLSSERYLAVRARLEAEHENLREALRWALPSDPHEQGPDISGDLGVLLCAAVGEFWLRSGYFTEGRNWIERAVERSDSPDRPELARCLSHLSRFLVVSGDFGAAREFASASVEMWRRLDDEAELQAAVNRLAFVELNIGRPENARELYRDVLTRARRSGDAAQLRTVLLHLALLESHEQHYERSLDLQTEALEIALSVAEPTWIVVHRQNIACSLRQLGRVDEANAQMLSVIPTALQLGEPILLLVLAEDLAAVVADRGDAQMAARLLGAAEAMRERLAAPREPAQQAEVGPPIDRARQSLGADAWAKHYSLGRATSLSEALASAVTDNGTAQPAGARQSAASAAQATEVPRC